MNLFFALAQSCDDLVFVWKSTGEMLWVNPAFERQTGMTVADFGFRNADNPFIHPDDLPGVLRALEAFSAAEKRVSSPIENRFFDMWGRLRALRSVVHKIDWHGDPALMFVAKMLWTENPVQLDEGHRRLVEAADDGVLHLSTAGKVVFSNRRMHEIANLRHVELAGRDFVQLFALPDQTHIAGILARVIAGEPTLGFESMLQSVQRWVDVKLVSIDGSDPTRRCLVLVRDTTEARVAQSALRQEQQLLQALFNGLPGTVCAFDLAGQFVRWNRNLLSLYGWSELSMGTLRPSDLVVDWQREKMSAFVALVFGQGSATTLFLALSATGVEIPIECTGVCVSIDGVAHALVIGIDISERLATESALRDSERNYREIFNATSDALLIHDDKGRVLDVNDRMCTLFRCDRAGALQLSIGSLVTEQPSSLRSATEEYMLRTIRDGAGVVEWRMRRLDGSLFWAEVGMRVTTIRGELRVIASVRDVSERHDAMQEILAWKERYELLTLAAGNIVYDRDRAGEIVWGGVVREMLGYPPEAMTGGLGQWSARVHPDDRERVSNVYVLAEIRGEMFQVEYRFCTAVGTYVHLEDNGFPRFDDEGRVERFIGVMVNVTQKKRAEQEHARLEESLRQAQKMESVGRLAGGVAHDFNNLLTAIIGNNALALLDLEPGHPARETLEESSQAAHSAANLTRQLLAFSRKQVIDPRILRLNDVVIHLHKMLARLLGENVELVVKPGSILGAVRIDPGQMEQVLVNLSVNARDAMPHGGRLLIETSEVYIEPVVALAMNVPPGAFVKLTITDSGSGMTDEVKARLFEPFFTTKDHGKGTGLGLAMVYGAVTQNGGSIEVISTVGEGTTFNILLPKIDATPEMLRSDPPPVLAFGQETIVLVEDEEQVRTLAHRLLARMGYHVYPFADGASALAWFARSDCSVDLLITDVVMPGMNGSELARQMREIRPDLHVLFSSGYSEDVIARHGVIQAGIEFISKPYALETLSTRVRTILDR